MADELLTNGYNAALVKLNRQDATLTSIRNRSTSLLSATTIATGIAASVGILNTDPTKGALFPATIAVVVACLVLALGLLVLFIQWPSASWSYGIEPEAFVEANRSLLNPDEALVAAINAMTLAGTANDKVVRYRFYALQASIIILMMNFITVIVAVSLIGR